MVTSTADSGLGSLREAISLANANGTLVNDVISFNLADVTVAGRTIILLSALPALSSHLTIDGTTQRGSAFGVSDAKVTIQYLYEANTPQTVFLINECTDINIFGLKLDNQIIWTAWYEETTCVNIWKSDHINIGGKGKGNLFINWIHTIFTSAPVGLVCKDIKIQSNIFGIEDDGETAAYNVHVIEINRIENLEVGGEEAEEGNVIAASRRRILIGRPSGTILIANNKIGTNCSGTKMLSMPYGESNLLHDNISVLNSGWAYEIDYKTEIRIINNLSTGYCSSGIKIQGFGKKFFIQGNKIGTDVLGINPLTPGMDYGIFIENCRDGLIGYETDEMKQKNIIAFAKKVSSGGTYLTGDAIAIANTVGVLIRRNSIFCNEQKGIGIDTNGAYKAPLITVNAINNSSISGTAPPNALIEIFRDDNCPNCEGKTYLETIYADANGKWAKNDVDPNSLVFTATDVTRHMTSEFSAPYMRRVGYNITNATCGKSNGSITGWEILSGTTWHWEDETGKVVGTDTNLVNIGSGRYRLVVGIGTAGCSRSTDFFYVEGDTIPSSVNVIATAASCGNTNGSLYSTIEPYKYNFLWLNSAGDSTFNAPSYFNVRPGTYLLKLSLILDSSCNRIYGPFNVSNTSGASLNTSGIVVGPANCGGNTGSITGITLSGNTGNTSLAWLNLAGNIVASTLDLTGMLPGKYQLAVMDASGCDTVKTDVYTIPSSGDISIINSGVKIVPVGCDGSGGNVLDIVVNGTGVYKWINIATGEIAGTGKDLLGQLPGNYQLITSNTTGCSDTSAIFEITKASIDSLHITSKATKDAYCNTDNGSLSVTGFDKDYEGYSFRWLQSNNTVAGEQLNLSNIAPGEYRLFAKDKNRCDYLVEKFTVKLIPAPVITAAPFLSPEKCNLKNGSIKDVQITGLQRPTIYIWTDVNNVTVSMEKDASGLVAGTYKLKVTDAGFCNLQSADYTIPAVKTPLSVPQYDAMIIPKNTSAVLTIRNPELADYELYQDASATNMIAKNNTGNFSTPVLYNDTSFYILKLLGSCISAITQVRVSVIDKTVVFVPTAFTPNKDGINDELHITIFGLMKLNYFKVYNIYGQNVFSTTNPATGWDGTFKGLRVPEGAFVWTASGIDAFGKPYSGKGNFLLLR